MIVIGIDRALGAARVARYGEKGMDWGASDLGSVWNVGGAVGDKVLCCLHFYA